MTTLPSAGTVGELAPDRDGTPRCSVAARARREAPFATAPAAPRLLLLEVPGAWGRAGVTASRLPPAVSGPLAQAADAAGVRVQLIRRPGRHAGPRGGAPVAGRQTWALVEPATGVVRWGWWADESQLLDLDLAQPLPPVADATGPRRLALVCTHARHDVCCALRGRPVAAALAAAGCDREVWETSHLGGDRFAANVLLLPEGELFGGLDEATAVEAARTLDSGRLLLAHHRGRVGIPPAQQAALHLAAVALGDDRRGALRVLDVAPAPVGPASVAPPSDGRAWEDGRRLRAVLDHRGDRYLLDMVEWWAEPERLSCTAVAPKPARRFSADTLRRC